MILLEFFLFEGGKLLILDVLWFILVLLVFFEFCRVLLDCNSLFFIEFILLYLEIFKSGVGMIDEVLLVERCRLKCNIC